MIFKHLICRSMMLKKMVYSGKCRKCKKNNKQKNDHPHLISFSGRMESGGKLFDQKMKLSFTIRSHFKKDC